MNPKTKVVFLQPLIPPDAGWDEIVEQARERGLEVRRLYEGVRQDGYSVDG